MRANQITRNSISSVWHLIMIFIRKLPRGWKWNIGIWIFTFFRPRNMNIGVGVAWEYEYWVFLREYWILVYWKKNHFFHFCNFVYSLDTSAFVCTSAASFNEITVLQKLRNFVAEVGIIKGELQIRWCLRLSGYHHTTLLAFLHAQSITARNPSPSRLLVQCAKFTSDNCTSSFEWQKLSNLRKWE